MLEQPAFTIPTTLTHPLFHSRNETANSQHALGAALAILVFLLCITAWIQFTGVLPMAVNTATRFMAVVGSAIVSLIAYAWADRGYR